MATINTVSPLGTALTVPRSHPVTGMMTTRDDANMRSRGSSRFFEVLFREEIWKKMSLRGVRECIHFFQTNADERDSQSTRTHTPTTAGRENCALLREQRERISNTRFCDFYNIYITVRYIFRSLRAIVFKGIFERRTARAESRRLLVVGGPPSSLLRCPRLFFR